MYNEAASSCQEIVPHYRNNVQSTDTQQLLKSTLVANRW